MQTPGHVRLNQVTGHHQLLGQFAFRCRGSRPIKQQHQCGNAVATAIVSCQQHQPVAQHVHYCTDCRSWLPLVSSKQGHCRQQQHSCRTVARSAASIDVADTIDASTQPHTSTVAVAVATQAQQHGRALIDPSALPMADRVKLLLRSKAARARGSTRATSRKDMHGLDVLTACDSAGVHGSAAAFVVDHVVKARVTGRPESLASFLTNYKQLAEVFGSTIVLQWLKRVPSVIRNAQMVPGRLRQLQLVMTEAGQQQPVALTKVLELTRRCPQVLGVDADQTLPRARAICDLLGRPHSCVPDLVEAAPALLGMSGSTLESKINHLQAMAASNPYWAQTYATCSTTSLAILLTYSMQRYARLQYLSEQERSRPIRMTTVLSYSDERMVEKYPAYAGWVEEQQQRQSQTEAAAAQQRLLQHIEDPDTQQTAELYQWSSKLQFASAKRHLSAETAVGRHSITAVL